jgi:hypothetical protein
MNGRSDPGTPRCRPHALPTERLLSNPRAT